MSVSIEEIESIYPIGYCSKATKKELDILNRAGFVSGGPLKIGSSSEANKFLAAKIEQLKSNSSTQSL